VRIFDYELKNICANVCLCMCGKPSCYLFCYFENSIGCSSGIGCLGRFSFLLPML
jgi:hypothetical protein